MCIIVSSTKANVCHGGFRIGYSSNSNVRLAYYLASHMRNEKSHTTTVVIVIVGKLTMKRTHTHFTRLLMSSNWQHNYGTEIHTHTTTTVYTHAKVFTVRCYRSHIPHITFHYRSL